MTKFSELRPVARNYVILVVSAGALTLAHSIHSLWVEPIGLQWLVIAALTLLTGSFTVKVPSLNASLSVSETFVFASVLLFGPPAGAATVLLECLIILFWMPPQARPVHVILFNTAAPAISIWVSGTVFFLVSDIQSYSQPATQLSALFLPLLTFTALYFLLNSWLVAIALGFETKQSATQIWWKNFTWLSVNYFSGASVAALLVTYTPSHALDFSTLAIIVPLLVVSYLTFRTAMGRVEDSNNHLSELNRLYLSTIETLAMAIDAKDQITHGHIRRVQAFAVGLAHHLGVSDRSLLKAIEAAALLHDMGKLAVPEYILNKPGKLTDAEFEKMKLHASVGADILSAIDFPYPVVPIVRHHHENWDGTGYPSGLKAINIPIGARILSVVDCFDALTSDRPYRPRLTDEQALTILVERRGTMYDPLVVDTFIRVYSQLCPETTPGRLPRHVLNEITGSTQVPLAQSTYPHFEQIAASSDEMLTLYDLASGLAGLGNMSEVGDIIANHLRRLIPFTQSAVFVYDAVTDDLQAKYANGNASSLIGGLRISRGQRLSGWVAANHRTIVNSDPILDLGDVARTILPRLRSCLSTCITYNGQLVGVLTLYSDAIEAFNDNHRRIIEVVAKQIGPIFRIGPGQDVAPAGDAMTGLPELQQLEDLLEATSVGTNVTLVFVEVANLEAVGLEIDHHTSEEVLRQVAQQTKSALRSQALLFRFGTKELVAVFSKNDDGAESAAERIRSRLAEVRIALKTGQTFSPHCIVSRASLTPDGKSIKDLLASAHSVASGHQLTNRRVH
jgi:diguanylate cyclase (GGDEF)-like protein/putative nucleotidyltransferase with HDIG domain